MQETYGLPEVGLVAVAQLICIPAHHVADDLTVLEMKFTLVVLVEQLPCLLSGQCHNNASLGILVREVDVVENVVGAEAVIARALRAVAELQLRIRDIGAAADRALVAVALTLLLALRLAVIFAHARRTVHLPVFSLSRTMDEGQWVYTLAVDPQWLARHPLTNYLLEQEALVWARVGVQFILQD